MRLIDLFENDVKGDSVDPSDHTTLFHLTDWRGLSHSINQNSLSSRSSYVSTTYDSAMNSVGGRNHYHFKFILDGKKCLEQYSGNYYKSYAHQSDGNLHWYNEKEIGLNTREIKPLSQYCTGLVILISVFSRSFIQWMFYENKEDHDMFGNLRNSQAPKGITSIRKINHEWKKPLYIQLETEIRPLNKEESQFLNDCFELSNKDINFDSALYSLAGKYPGKIKDHMGKVIKTQVLDKEKYAAEIRNGFNDLLANKPISKIEPNKTREYVKKWIVKLGFKEDLPRIMKALEAEDLFNPDLEPIRWGGIFDDLIEGDLNEVMEYIKYAGEELKRRKRVSGSLMGDEGNRRHTKMWVS